MVMTPDPHLNLRADIQATYQALGARMKAGGNWRSCAENARELGRKLDALAEMEQFGDRPRHRSSEPAPSPDSGEAFLGERLAGMREAARRQRVARQVVRDVVGRRRFDLTQVEPEPEPPPALPDGTGGR